MYVVAVGTRHRCLDSDRVQVFGVLELLRRKYKDSLIIVSTSCDAGIGQFVKERCRVNKVDFRLFELTQRIYADIPKARLQQAFKARNAFLAELGDEFHIFLSLDRSNLLEQDLISRVGSGDRVVKVYLPGEDPERFSHL